MASIPYKASINLALETIQKDKNLSLRAAAKIYDVTINTIRNRRDGKLPRRDLLANSRKLTDLEEKSIVHYLIKLSKFTRSFPPR